MHLLKKWLTTAITWIAAFIFLVEEAIWDATAALMAKLGAVRLIHAIEQHIAALPSRWALVAFLLPSLILIPAKLIGLHAIASGHLLIGGTVFLMAKIAGMALFSRIFNLTRPALMQYRWFKQLYDNVMLYRNRIHDYLAHWHAYQAVKQRIHAIITRTALFFRRKR